MALGARGVPQKCIFCVCARACAADPKKGPLPAQTFPAGAPTMATTGLRFLGVENELDSQLGADLALLARFTVPQLQEFAGLIVSWVIAPKSSDIKASVGAFAQAQGVPGSVVKGSMRGLLLLMRGALKHNVTPQQMRGDLVAIGLDSERAETMQKLWRANYMELARSAAVQTMQIKSLVNMEWKFGVTAASEELDSLGSTFLHMKLTLASGASQEPCHVEMSLPQFYEFLAKMEEAKAEMDRFE